MQFRADHTAPATRFGPVSGVFDVVTASQASSIASAMCASEYWRITAPNSKATRGIPLLAAVAIRINLAEDAGGPKAPEVVETTGYLEWGGQTNGSSGSSGGLCD